jgi:hypothetical protein
VYSSNRVIAWNEREMPRPLSAAVTADIRRRGDRPCLHAWTPNTAAIARYASLPRRAADAPAPSAAPIRTRHGCGHRHRCTAAGTMTIPLRFGSRGPSRCVSTSAAMASTCRPRVQRA